MANAHRPFDLVLYGATGFTGRLVAAYLVRYCADNSDAPRWAMAGRSAAKLAQLRDEIGAPTETPLIVADAGNPDSLAAMARQARIVLTTVGPYQLYGEPMVKACVETATDYVDLCGEPLWMRAMIDAYELPARASGTRICFSAGFDSIPFDLGVVLLQRECIARFGAPARRVKGRVRGLNGGFSGGTAESIKSTWAAVAKDEALAALLSDPFALTPGFTGPEQPGGGVQLDEATGSWAAPFIMAPINTKNVHRTNFLRGHPWGRDFAYDELVLTGPGELGEQIAQLAAATAIIGREDDPLPGEGPSGEMRAGGFFDMLMIGELSDGNRLDYSVKIQGDPGYECTSRMFVQTGIALLSHDSLGGIWTPGALIGEALAGRLTEHAGIAFGPEKSGG